jgi:hypothetical protein
MKSQKINKYVASLTVLYISIYFGYIYPLTRIQQLQTKEWATTLIENTILGVKDPSYLYKINQSKIDHISCYYNFFFMNTPKYTIYIVFNLHNQYSTKATLSVYLYNFETKTRDLHQTVLNFNDVQTSKRGDILHITCGDSYIQKLNMITNKMTMDVQMPSIQLSFEFDIEDYTTIFPTFLPRYDAIKSIVRPYSPQTSTPGEWSTYNPMMGKIIKGSLNHETIETGNFWHENLLGVNDYFITSNIWYFIVTDDWLIYNLWFGEVEDENKTYFFIVKHRKTNKVIRAGVVTNAVPLPFKPMDTLINPVHCKCTSTKPIGTLNYDSFTSYFETHEISIQIESIPNECHRVFLYDYYDSGDTTNKKFDIVNNYKYVEYITFVNVEIKYNGKTEVFTARCGVDAFFKKDKNLPDSF